MKKYLLFDLDGTLTNPEEGITKSVQIALEHFRIHVEDRKELIPFIGPPLMDQFMEVYGFTREQAREAVTVYRSYYTTKGLYENLEYAGIRQMLGALKSAGYELFVATSKPEFMAVEILKHFGYLSYFKRVAGADEKEDRVRKGDVIRYLMKEAGIREVSEAVMIGDRKHDVLGAREVGMDSIGVLYGFGSREELMEAGAGWIAETVEDLEEYLLMQTD